MFDAYTVAVRLSLVNGVSGGLAKLASEFRTMNGFISESHANLTLFEQKMERLKSMGYVGAMMAGVGVAGLAALKGPYEDAKRLAQAQADFGTLNLSAADNATAFAKAAAQSQQILGTNITENVKGIHDLHTAFGDLHHALRTADEFAKFSFVAKVMNGGHAVDGLVYNAAKALEHRGGRIMNDDGAFRNELDLMERVYLGSRTKVNPSEFFHASQTGKLAYTLMSAEELYGPFAAYMQSKSGATAGTAQMTFVSSLIGGHMTNKAKGFLADLNLWDEGVSPARARMFADMTRGMSPEERKAMGFITPSAGGLKDQYTDLAVQHTSEFVQNVLAPAIRKKYGNVGDDKLAEILMANFNRSTSDVMGEYIVNALKFKKDAAIFSNSKGIADAYQHYLKSPEGSEIAAGEAWRNLMTVIGSVYLPTVTKGLLHFAEMLTKIGAWMDAHPTMTKVIVYATGAISGLAALGGPVLALKASIGTLAALFPTLATGAGAAVATIAALVRPLLLIGAAGAGAYAAGTWIEGKLKHSMVGRADDWLDEHLFGIRRPPDLVMATERSNVRTSAQRGSSSTPVILHMDGRRVGEGVMPSFADQLAKPWAGSSFDPTMSLRPVAAPYGQ